MTSKQCPHIWVSILGTNYEALLDSGAAVSIISDLEIIKKHNLKIQAADLRIKTADETEHLSLGKLYIPYTFDKITKVIPTLYVPQISKRLILGIDFWKEFKITPAKLTKTGWKPVIVNSINIEQVISEGENKEEINIIVEPSGERIFEKSINEDISLEIPSVEIPKEYNVGQIKTEHELNES